MHLMITGCQARMGRAALRLGVRDVALAARVSIGTVSRVEADLSANPATLDAIKRALEAAGLEFIPDTGDGAGVRLKDRKPAHSDEPLWHPSFRSHKTKLCADGAPRP